MSFRERGRGLVLDPDTDSLAAAMGKLASGMRAQKDPSCPPSLSLSLSGVRTFFLGEPSGQRGTTPRRGLGGMEPTANRALNPGNSLAEAEAAMLWPPDVKSRRTGKDADAGKD